VLKADGKVNTDSRLRRLVPSGTVGLAAVLVVLTGFVTAVCGVALGVVLAIPAWAAPIPLAVLIFGLYTMHSGVDLYRTGAAAARSAVVCCGMLMLLGTCALHWRTDESMAFASAAVLITPCAFTALILSALTQPTQERAPVVFARPLRGKRRRPRR